MKFNAKHLLITGCALSISVPTLAEVVLEVPQEISILAVNEDKANLDGGLFSDTRTLTLPNGENQIVFKYEVAFEERNDREFVESNAIIASFNVSDIELRFDMPKYRNLLKAEKNIKNLEWKLTDDDGKVIVVKEDQLLKDGMQVGRNYVRESEEYNRKNNGRAVWSDTSSRPAASTVVMVKNPTTGQETSTTTPTSTTAEEMLFFWYDKADAETKQKFKEFIIQQ